MAIIKGIDPSNIAKQSKVIASIGSMTSDEIGVCLAQQAATVAGINGLSVEEMTNTVINNASSAIGTGIGMYGITPEMLERYGYIKPGTVDQFLGNPALLESVLKSPSVWTGLNGITEMTEFLDPAIQSFVQTDIWSNSFNELVDAGILNGFEDSNIVAGITSAAASFGPQNVQSWLDGTLSPDIASAMDTIASGAGYSVDFLNTKLLPELSGLGGSIEDTLSGLTGNLTSVLGSIDTGEIISQAGNIVGNLNVSENINGLISGITGDITSTLSNVSLGNIGINEITNNIGDITSNLESVIGQVGSIDVNSITGQITNNLSGITSQLGGLGESLSGALGGALGGVGNMFSNGSASPVTVRPPAATGTVSRGGVDAAMTALIGNIKIVPPLYTGQTPGSYFELPTLTGLPNIGT